MLQISSNIDYSVANSSWLAGDFLASRQAKMRVKAGKNAGLDLRRVLTGRYPFRQVSWQHSTYKLGTRLT